MSIPTHNLYEFIHTLIKNKMIMFHFYEWGDKNLSNLKSSFDFSPNDFVDENIFFKKSLPGKYIEYIPLLFCHDQEPLNYDLYTDDVELVKDIIQRNKIKYPLYDFKDWNLKNVEPAGCIKKIVLLHSELNSKELYRYEITDRYYGAYYWSHAFISRFWFAYAEYDPQLSPASDIRKDFLVYCRDTSGLRQYRKVFLEKIQNLSLTNKCRFRSKNTEIDATSSATYSASDINETMIHVILETVFDQRIHLSEKTLRPIACGHPFIIMNGPGTLKYLKKYGFKTFSPLINEDYDKEKCSTKRMNMVVEEMHRIANLNIKQKHKLSKQLYKIAYHNKKVFFSKKFYCTLIEELEHNLNNAYTQVKDEYDYNLRWYQYKQKCLAEPDFYKITQDKINERKQLLTLIRHTKKGGTLEDYVPPNLD